MAEETLLTTYVRAWNDHDASACAACFAVDARRELRILRGCDEQPGPLVLHGPAEIADDIAALLTAVPDVSVEVISAGYASDQRLWTEWCLHGTRTGGRGRWRSSDRRIEVFGVSVFGLSNQGFTEEHAYWDTALARGRREALPGLSPIATGVAAAGPSGNVGGPRRRGEAG